MDQKTTGIVSYLTLIGWIVALVTRKEKTEYTSFHLRQMLGIVLIGIVSNVFVFIPKVGTYISWALTLAAVIFWIIAIIGAANEEKKLVPVLGEKFQEWFTFL